MPQLKDVAFTYDNAVALTALIGCGRADLASRIGDGLLTGLSSDRYWHDGRLRNAYLAGATKDRPLKLPGWWDAKQNKWVEDGYQVGSDTGNLAWAMLALGGLYRATHASKYLSGAERIGGYLAKAYDDRDPRGFIGGTFGDEPNPARDDWKSTEHNADLTAAFSLLAAITQDAEWEKRAGQARAFVDRMWRPGCRCFAAGTTADGHTLNESFALDAQILPLLALPDAARFAGAEGTAQRRAGRPNGFSYTDAGNGIWTEGTAQVALLYALSRRPQQSDALLKDVARNRAPDGFYFATDASRAPTGFRLATDASQPLLYFHLPHLGATAWVALAETRFDPFTIERSRR